MMLISSSDSSRLLALYDTLYHSDTATGESQVWLNQWSGGGTIPSGLNLS
jgi:hypothetical protein